MVGRTVGHYRIVSELGAGGMGIVYKAHDVRLERFLALKFLKPERVTDDFRRRFLQEARASSALHHPNIVHVYDIGEFEGHDYIAMEFVDGPSLRQILRDRRLDVPEAVRIAVQVADAMAAAHAVGIIHRDLKPGNLMITPSGLVKILDFGLAKLASQSPPAIITTADLAGPPPDDPDTTLSAITITTDQTQLGIAVGSPAFMSPEQAMGRQVDWRSDIFSLGSILYEMLTGRRAFLGEKTMDVIDDVVRKYPPAPSTLNTAVTDDLDAVVMRALHKDPSQRFQNMGELRAALHALTGASSSSFIVVSPPAARSRRRVLAIAAAAAVAVIGPLAYMALHNGPAAESRSSLASLKASRLTLDPGLHIDPAISPDGKFVAYASDRSGEGNLDIWVRQIGGAEPIRLTRDPAEERDPTFSPDGTSVAFRSERDGGGIFMVPTLGGEARKLIPGGRRPRFSPDGTRIAYWKGARDPFPLRAGNGASFIYDLATGQSRQIAEDFPAAVHPVWSPDGKQIVFIGLKDPANLHTFNWWILPLAGGAPVLCPVNTSYLEVPFAWRGDRIFYESGGGQIGAKIGQVKIDPRSFQPVSPPASLTAGTTDEFCPSVSRDGKLVFSALTRNTNLYALPLDVNRGKPLGPLQPLTRDLGENTVRSVSADGKRVAFLTRRPADGPNQVWVRDLAGGTERVLTAGDRDKTGAEISPDGSRVVWRENSTKVKEMFVTPVDGGGAVKLCGDCTQAAWSPGGDLLAVLISGGNGIGLVKLGDTEQSRYLPSQRGREVRPKAISRDGKWLAFTSHRSQTDYTIFLAPFAPDRPPSPSEWIEVANSTDTHPFPRWSPDGNLLYFGSSRDGYDCIWAQRLQPRSKRPEGKPFVIQHFHLPTQVLESPNFAHPLALSSNGAILSITERTGGLWMLDLDTAIDPRP